MKDLSHRASSARREKDQELEFMYLHRYLTLLTFASSDPSVSKKDEKWKREFLTAQINEKFYRNLTEKLKARWVCKFYFLCHHFSNKLIFRIQAF